MDSFLTAENVYVSTFIFCFLSGFIPIFNAEAAMLAISALLPEAESAGLIPVVAIAAVGQMFAKALLYLAGRGVLNLPLGRFEEKVAETQARFEKWQGKTDLMIFVSSSTGFPPFYFISIISGMLKFSLPRFIIAGTLGRFLRFGIIALFPQLIQEYF